MRRIGLLLVPPRLTRVVYRARVLINFEERRQAEREARRLRVSRRDNRTVQRYPPRSIEIQPSIAHFAEVSIFLTAEKFEFPAKKYENGKPRIFSFKRIQRLGIFFLIFFILGISSRVSRIVSWDSRSLDVAMPPSRSIYSTADEGAGAESSVNNTAAAICACARARRDENYYSDEGWTPRRFSHPRNSRKTSPAVSTSQPTGLSGDIYL